MVKEATVREEEAGKRVSNFQATLKALAKYSDFNFLNVFYFAMQCVFKKKSLKKYFQFWILFGFW